MKHQGLTVGLFLIALSSLLSLRQSISVCAAATLIEREDFVNSVGSLQLLAAIGTSTYLAACPKPNSNLEWLTNLPFSVFIKTLRTF